MQNAECGVQNAELKRRQAHTYHLKLIKVVLDEKNIGCCVSALCRS